MAPRSTLNESEAPENIPLCYDSVNGSCPKFTYPIVIRVPLYVFLGTTVVITVIGNLLVIITVAHFKQLHTPTNYLIFSLAVADLLVGGIVMPPSVMRSVESCWYLGELFCKIHTSTSMMCCTASIINLTMISIDRYYAISQPLLYKSKITISVVVIMNSINWVVSSIFGFGVVFLEFNLLGIEELYNSVVCEGSCIFLHGLFSSSLSSVLSFYMPGIILACIYLNIFVVAQKQVRSIHLINMNMSGKPSLIKIERKATKTLAIIMGVFLSSWIPFFLVFTIDPHVGYGSPKIAYEILGWVGYLNSTVNPFVYAYFYRWFRQAFKIIVSGKIFKQDSSRTMLTLD
ncbi:trace amine-associated receptor 1-like [Clupea harengus]|uniref:Trace amine-associated receptor 1 n=1 Tax=Clupea harengus TaxID=7950 RepID=A0A6P3VXY4_CLUHA|nr:trace amine-associated receptor 1-like [Clupea harengus]